MSLYAIAGLVLVVVGLLVVFREKRDLAGRSARVSGAPKRWDVSNSLRATESGLTAIGQILTFARECCVPVRSGTLCGEFQAAVKPFTRLGFGRGRL